MGLIITSALLLAIMLFVNKAVFTERENRISSKEFFKVITRF